MTYDTIIIGGGIVGLTIAALLQKNNFSVAVIESKTPQLDWDLTQPTARASAIHNTSKKLFDYLGVWDLFEKKACAPLQKMEIWDHTQNAHLHFDAKEIGETEMGWIVDNREIVKTLWQNLPNCDLFFPNKPCHFDGTILTLDNEKQLKTNLIIGADGHDSWVRKQMPIGLKIRSYQQSAIVAVIESEQPHHHTAYQKFLSTGPIALLPLSNAHQTALVWSADTEISNTLMEKSQDVFARELTHQMDFKLGHLTLLSERAQFPLTMRHAEDYVSPHFALAGDAAHTIHPLAGLGVNLGLMDAACLMAVLSDARNNKKSLGDFKILRRYSRWRRAENTPVMIAMRGLKDIFSINTPSLNIIRNWGVNTLNQCNPIKKQLMQIATGHSKDLPVFLQN